MNRKHIVVPFILGMIITGCTNTARSKETKEENNPYTLVDNRTIDEYEKLSQYGIDYLYLPLAENWSRETFDDDCIKYAASNDIESTIYILRNIEAKEDDSESFRKALQGRDIPSHLETQVNKYLSTDGLEPSSSALSYIGDLKFYNTEGTCTIDGADYYYIASYFQTRLYQPSVKVHKTPTVFIIVYKNNRDTDNIKNMRSEFQYSLIYEQ